MQTLIHDRVARCRRGENPMAVCRVPSGWVVLGDTQFLPGYSLLLPDPVVGSLNDLSLPARQTFLTEMSILGDALLAVTDAFRINYEILGNAEAALHAHVFPRYLNEPDEFRRGPIWQYDRNHRRTSRPFDPERDRPLMEALCAKLKEAGVCTE